MIAPERLAAMKALQERRAARGLRDPLNLLRARIAQRVADGAPIATAKDKES